MSRAILTALLIAYLSTPAEAPEPSPVCRVLAEVNGQLYEWTNPPGVTCRGTVTLRED